MEAMEDVIAGEGLVKSRGCGVRRVRARARHPGKGVWVVPSARARAPSLREDERRGSERRWVRASILVPPGPGEQRQNYAHAGARCAGASGSTGGWCAGAAWRWSAVAAPAVGVPRAWCWRALAASFAHARGLVTWDLRGEGGRERRSGGRLRLRPQARGHSQWALRSWPCGAACACGCP